MTEKVNKGIQKMADRVLEGYHAVHEKDYQKGKKLLEPLTMLLHQEDRPNLTFLSYLSITQIGTKDIDAFLSTYEELQKYEAKSKKEEALKNRVEKMFHELMTSLQVQNSND